MASLVYTLVIKWETKKPGNRLALQGWDTYLLNTNRMITLTQYGVILSNLLYSNNPNDSRESPDYLQIFWPPVLWTIWNDEEPASKFGTFPIFPDFDRTGTAVDTDIQWENVAYVYETYQDGEYGQAHMVYYRDSWKRVECLIDMSMVGVLAMQDAS